VHTQRSCKIDYWLSSNRADQSIAPEFFTGDYMLVRKTLEILWIARNFSAGRCARRCGRATPPTSPRSFPVIDRLRQRFASADACVVAAVATTYTAQGESKFNIERDNPMRPIRHGTTV
jgi:hypothetical protein